jgi:hypothetical protein
MGCAALLCGPGAVNLGFSCASGKDFLSWQACLTGMTKEGLKWNSVICVI